MGAKASKAKAEIHATALTRFDLCVDASQGEREQSVEDRRFATVLGAMWDGEFGEQFANRPMLEINKLHLAIIRIYNEYRNNRINATFVSTTGAQDDDLADFCADLHRGDQEDSVAEEAFDNAFDEGTTGGFGAWRLRAEYEDEYDEDDDRQRVRFEPITDADTCVFFDLNSKRQDKSDADYCFVLTGMTRDAFEKEHPDEDPAGWDRTVSAEYEFDWVTPELIYVAEYYCVKETTEKQNIYRAIDGSVERIMSKSVTEEMSRQMDEVGTILIGTRKIKRRAVHKYFLSGGGILSDEGRIAGREIPIVPFYGKRWFINGVERFSGHVRYAKDAARLYNMQISALAEDAADGGDRTPIFTPEQTAGHEGQWAGRGVDKPAFLHVNPLTNPDGSKTASGPVGYTESPEVNQAMAALLELSNRDVGDLLGNQDQGDKIESNLSGKAYQAVHKRLDMQTFIYVSNFGKAQRRSAAIWLSMASELYDEDDREMKTIDETGDENFVNIGDTFLNEKGEPAKKFDLSRAKFKTKVAIGPSSETKREATIDALTGVLPFVEDPVDKKVVTSTILMNIEGENMSAVREHARKQLVQVGAMEPNDDDIEAAENAPPVEPGAQEIYLESEANKNAALAQKAQVDAELNTAKIDETKATTVETLAGIDQTDRAQALETAKVIQMAVNGSGPAAPNSREKPKTGTTSR